MKKFFFLAALACMSLFVSCSKGDVPHTGDNSGKLYGIWTLNTKTEITKDSEGKETSKSVDYTDNHFYLALSEFPIPHAIAKKGSFTDLDLEDVDVKAATFTYNSDQKKINFDKLVLLTDDLLSRRMALLGTFDVLELTDTQFSIRQEDKLLGGTVVYTFKKQK